MIYPNPESKAHIYRCEHGHETERIVGADNLDEGWFGIVRCSTCNSADTVLIRTGETPKPRLHAITTELPPLIPTTGAPGFKLGELAVFGAGSRIGKSDIKVIAAPAMSEAL